MQRVAISNELAPYIFTVVAQIPSGKVATYGQVARLAGLPRHARLVGRLLKQLDADSELPWHRVLNAQGQLHVQQLDVDGQNQQQVKLMAEGVLVINGRVKLKDFLWQVESPLP